MERLVPADAAEVCAIVAEGRPMELVGAGSRAAMLARVDAERVLDLSALSGVVLYEPSELVMSVRAATPLAQVEALLAAQGQQLAFEPPDFGPLWGAAPGAGTVGGMLSLGLGGPRRPFAGAPRDHLLGFKGVNGTGEAFAAGGRVVKNVTGFDLPKLMAGAQGALGVLTEVTLKVLPEATAARTLVFHGLDEHRGLALLRDALASPVAVTGAAHLPADVAERLGLAGAATLLRVETMEAVADLAVDRLRNGFPAERGDSSVLDAAATRTLWRAVGGASPFGPAAGDVWRISAPRASAGRLGAALRQAGAASLYYDWAGGLLWALAPAGWVPPAFEGSRRRIRGGASAARSDGGALARRVKQQFDPLGLFNPGRLAEAG